jgi:hypothetical protein
VPHQETFALLPLPVVLTGGPLVRFGLLPERLGVQLPGVLCSLPSRLRTVGVPKALLYLRRLLVQSLGAAVSGKLTCPRSRSPFPCSRHPSQVRPPPSLPIPDVAVQSEAAARAMNRAKIA